MKLGIVSAQGRIEKTGVVGYGGLERWAVTLAQESQRLGHEVHLVGNVDNGPILDGVTGFHLGDESEVLKREPVELLKSCDLVLDLTHGSYAKLLKLERYRRHLFWTDSPAWPGQNIYPSDAVRQAFKDPKGPVIPIGIPLNGTSHTELPEPINEYVVHSRLCEHKGVDLAVKVAQKAKVPLTVAGHIWPGQDEYFGLRLAKFCRLTGFAYQPNPTNETVTALLERGRGLIALQRWLESFSIAVATALCNGVPVLTTDQGAPKEWVAQTHGGVVVPLADLEKGDYSGTKEFFERDWNRAGIAKRAREFFDAKRIVPLFLE